MSKRLPVLKGEDVVAILKKHGFKIMRQKGSHVFLRHNDGRTTVVPVHPREEKISAKAASANKRGWLSNCPL